MSPDDLHSEALTVLDSMHQQIALLGPDGTIFAVNRSWREFGLRNGAATGNPHGVGADYLARCDPASRAGIAAVLAGTSPQFEFEYPCHGGDEERWFQMRVSPLLGAHRSGAIVKHEDISARHRLEQQRATLINELTAANRELGEFAYVVSHDLKAPLRGINSLATWLVEDHADRLGDEGATQLRLIASRVKRLSALIDGILAYSRASRSVVERETVVLTDLVQNTIDLLAPPAHVRIEIAAPLPCLPAHPVRMQQVFQNLLANAIDFIDKPEGLIVLGCTREEAAWHFSVADNGCGIEAHHFERIFQLFQTLHSRDERERTGVGLALVKKVVELEGGRLWVESVKGEGTTFHFTLPAERAALR